MMQPVCCLCGEKIKANEHYFIIRSRTVCRECNLKINHRRSAELINKKGMTNAK